MCDDELRGKKLKALIPPSSGARYWSADYAERNQAVANQRLTRDNTRWKSITGYHRRSIAATARYRVNLCIKQDAARRYARKCTPCLKAAHSRDSLFQIRFIQQRRSGDQNNALFGQVLWWGVMHNRSLRLAGYLTCMGKWVNCEAISG